MTDFSTRPSWWTATEQNAATAGVDAEELWKITGTESSHGTNTVPMDATGRVLSSARGPFQITGPTWDDIQKNNPSLALGDRNDPNEQAKAAPYHYRFMQNSLASSLGKPREQLTMTEKGLGWFAGIGDAPRILSADPSTPLQNVMQPSSIVANQAMFAKNGIRTAGDLVAYHAQKYGDTGYQSPFEAAQTPKLDLSQYLSSQYKSDPEALGGTNNRLKVALANMLADAPPEVVAGFQINSAFRSVAKQQALYDKDVADHGGTPSGMVGKPGGSMHNHGEAMDLKFGSDEAKKWFHENAGKYGLDFPLMYSKGWKGPKEEDWHIELKNGRRAGVVGPLARDVAQTEQRLGATMAAQPASATDFYTNKLLQDAQAQQSYTTSQAIFEAGKHESVLRWMYEASGHGAPDPKWNGSTFLDQDKDRVKDLPASMQKDLIWSSSKDDYERKLKLAQDELEYERKMDGHGVIRFLAGALDPAAIGIGLINPAAGVGAKASRMARMLAVGAEMGAGNVLTDLPAAMYRPGFEKDQLLYSGLMGFTFGAGVGGLLKPHPALKDDISKMQLQAAKVTDEIENRHLDGGGAVGAAANGAYVPPVKAATSDFLSDAFDEANPKTAFSNVRWSYSGRGGGSENPLARGVMSRMVEDAIGKIDGSASNKAVTMEMTKLNMERLTWYAKQYSADWDEYVSRNKVGLFDKSAKEFEFKTAISDAVETQDAAKFAQFDPAIQRQAGFVRQWYDNWVETINNPGILDGTVRRGLLQEPLDKNPHYMPHIHDFQKFRDILAHTGEGNMIKVLENAIRSNFDDIEEGLVKKVAKSYYTGLRKAQVGTEADLGLKMSGFDRQLLREFLTESGEMSGDDIHHFLEKLVPKDNEGANVARLKKRTPVNVLAKTEVTVYDPKTGQATGTQSVSIKDWLERDSTKLAHMYSRTMSAKTALARFQIENPSWKPGHPAEERLLFDGIYGDSDFQRLLDHVKDVADQKGGKAAETVDKDVDRLKNVYETIRGRVDSLDRGNIGSFLRTLGNFNFARLMGQVGFAQVSEIWGGVAQTSLKTAFSNMPALKSFVRDAASGELKNLEAREIEWAASAGTDPIRSSVFRNVEPFGSTVEGQGAWRAVEDVSKDAAHVVSHLSGMQKITQVQQQWVAKMALGRFAEASEIYAKEGMDAASKLLNMKRMAALGIDPPRAERIFQEMRKHSSTFADKESGRDLRLMNFDKWDQGVRYDFEYALYAWTRRMIQENDLGQMNAVLGTRMGKTIFQFRNFMLGGWEKQTLANLHQAGLWGPNSMENYSMWMGTMVIGSMVYAAQMHLQSIGRSDRDKFLKERLSPEKLAAAAFQRSGMSSILPMLADQGAYLAGYHPLFDTRSTGSASQGFISNPSLGFVDSFAKAIRGGAGVASKGSPWSQSDERAAFSLLPGGNLLPFVWMNNALIRGLPEKG